MRLKPSLLIVCLLALLVIFPRCGYNTLQGNDEDVKAAWAEVENQYKRRADLVPNLVATVQGYAKHEKETLQNVVEARAKATAVTIDAKLPLQPKSLPGISKCAGPTLRRPITPARRRRELSRLESQYELPRSSGTA